MRNHNWCQAAVLAAGILATTAAEAQEKFRPNGTPATKTKEPAKRSETVTISGVGSQQRLVNCLVPGYMTIEFDYRGDEWFFVDLRNAEGAWKCLVKSHGSTLQEAPPLATKGRLAGTSRAAPFSISSRFPGPGLLPFRILADDDARWKITICLYCKTTDVAKLPKDRQALEVDPDKPPAKREVGKHERVD
jgi:hypothetical protein